MRRAAMLTGFFWFAIFGAANAAPVLTPYGFGDLKIGMREADAARQLGLRIAHDNAVDSSACRLDHIPRYPGFVVMAEKGVVSRISLETPSRLRTNAGIGIGSKEADLRRVYGRRLKIETAAYGDEPAHDLTFWAAKNKRGIRYGTDEQGRVRYIHAGGKSIQYIEGCL